jgi:hypothetical protein
MGSRLIKRMKHFACYEEFEEEKFEEHLRYNHGFDTRLQSVYISKLEGQIKALERRIRLLEDRKT